MEEAKGEHSVRAWLDEGKAKSRLSQYRLHQETGISQSYISRLAKGDYERPDPLRIVKLGRALAENFTKDENEIVDYINRGLKIFGYEGLPTKQRVDKALADKIREYIAIGEELKKNIALDDYEEPEGSGTDTEESISKPTSEGVNEEEGIKEKVGWLKKGGQFHLLAPIERGVREPMNGFPMGFLNVDHSRFEPYLHNGKQYLITLTDKPKEGEITLRYVRDELEAYIYKRSEDTPETRIAGVMRVEIPDR